MNSIISARSLINQRAVSFFLLLTTMSSVMSRASGRGMGSVRIASRIINSSSNNSNNNNSIRTASFDRLAAFSSFSSMNVKKNHGVGRGTSYSMFGAVKKPSSAFTFTNEPKNSGFRNYPSQLFSSTTAASESEEEYDWDVILPFQKNSHNSIKIVVPDQNNNNDDDNYDEQTTTTTTTTTESDPYEISTFHSKLEATIATAQQLHKTAIWLTIPISRARLMEEASKSGFEFHHAEGNSATLNKWLLHSEESRIPTYATHQVGVGAVVINPNTNEILCVREKRNNYRPWKIPGGLAELGEDLDTAVLREVLEETGIPCRFMSVLGVRHTHGMQFGRSDLFFVCRLEPVPDEETGEVPKPVPQEGEIEAVAWISVDEYRAFVNHPEAGKGHPMMSQIMKIVDQKDWEENDIQRTIVSSVVPGRRASPVYHAPIRSNE